MELLYDTSETDYSLSETVSRDEQFITTKQTFNSKLAINLRIIQF